jgi:5-hydroxyisourate hydrolase-like protein (transthyretin family)
MKRLILTTLLVFMVCAPAYAAGKYAVQGTVLFADGTPAAGLTVQLLQKKAKANLLQGMVRTAQNGAYRITYSPRRSLKSTSYFVRVLNSRNKQIYKSPIIKRPKFIETVNVNLP